MKKLLEFFKEDNGRLSNARLANFLITGGFMADWILHIIRSIEFKPDWAIVSLVAAIMGIKVLQKKFEK